MSLVVAGVSLDFGGFRALDGVGLTVPRCGLVGLIGPNGAGKSTLFSVISGFLAPDAGTITLAGRRIDRLSAPARARAGMVRTFQVPLEFGDLSVRDNLMAAAPGQHGETLAGLFMRPGRVRREEAAIAARAAEILDLLRLTSVARQRASQLSGGQKKLLEMGRALMLRPRLILLDEPFAGVNPVLIQEIAGHIAALHATGIGFLVIEHDLPALTGLVHHLLVMDRGRVIAEGPPASVLDHPAVRDAYLGGVAA